MAKRKSISDELRKAIAKAERSGVARGRIAALAGIHRAMMARLATGENLPRIDTAERIANALGYRIVLVSKSKRR